MWNQGKCNSGWNFATFLKSLFSHPSTPRWSLKPHPNLRMCCKKSNRDWWITNFSKGPVAHLREQWIVPFWPILALLLKIWLFCFWQNQNSPKNKVGLVSNWKKSNVCGGSPKFGKDLVGGSVELDFGWNFATFFDFAVFSFQNTQKHLKFSNDFIFHCKKFSFDGWNTKV